MLGKSRTFVSRLRTTEKKALFSTLTVASAGGVLFSYFELPLPWMLGAMIATLIASSAGATLNLPRQLRDPWITILGVMLGSAFNQVMFANVASWIVCVMALPAYILILGFLGRFYLIRMIKIEPNTAFFASFPGGLAEMVLLGDRHGGDMRAISLIHGTRVFLVVTILPFVIGYWTPLDSVSGPTAAADGTLETGQILVLGFCAILGYVVAERLRLPAPQMFGPMLFSAGAHLAGVVEGSPPATLVAIAQIVMGASIGVRFANIAVHEIARTMTIGAGLTGVHLCCSILVALFLSQYAELPFQVLLLAFSPGGVAEMSLIALSVGADPALVALMHILRIALVVSIAPLIFGIFKRWRT